MKLLKLVLTGTAILMCIIIVVFKKAKGFAQHTATVVQQNNSSPCESNDSITDYPFNLLVNLSY
jgi:hypothetical protein